MNKFARISVIDDERGLILGKDVGNLLEKGYVYELVECMEEIIIRKLGPYALTKQGSYPCEASDVNGIISGPYHLMTKQEKDKAMVMNLSR